MSARPTPRHAFTLLELLVVIGVIAILLAILLPALGRVRDQAQAVICASNLRQLGMAALAYVSDHKRLVPFSQFDATITNMSGGHGVNVRWCWSDDTPGDPIQAFRNGLLSRYLGDCTRIAGCPAFETPENLVEFYQSYNLAYPVVVHYGYNGLLLGEKHPNFNAVSPATPGYRVWVGYRLNEIDRPDTKVMFADSAQLVVSQILPNPTLSPPVTVLLSNGTPRATAAATVHGRHPGKRANVCWVDGHVSAESVRLYADQPDLEQRATLGYLAPDVGDGRSNEWMFVK